MAFQDDSKGPIEGLTYFYDFIRVLEKEYAFASVDSIAEQIELARDVGPVFAGLKSRDDGIYILRAPIGRGDFAIVELEIDCEGVLQPVMGGIQRKT